MFGTRRIRLVGALVAAVATFAMMPASGVAAAVVEERPDEQVTCLDLTNEAVRSLTDALTGLRAEAPDLAGITGMVQAADRKVADLTVRQCLPAQAAAATTPATAEDGLLPLPLPLPDPLALLQSLLQTVLDLLSSILGALGLPLPLPVP
ncbi:hypothetical protein Lfu02_07520 [Longispora fulva]|uniref:Secreted protein n=1 Tax=Longispora fulva TaxID=619741 RepID=A0A8J7KVJ6_9ACTN|nr:hypothetical protein [Longispora fulva]MBG6135377.1 hypothetical protein [Longispora fulva]GIG56380.1 hypothetical protein Lfu02_07520 [Longispora fulva]